MSKDSFHPSFPRPTTRVSLFRRLKKEVTPVTPSKMNGWNPKGHGGLEPMIFVPFQLGDF